MCIRSCSNCKNKEWHSWFGTDYCLYYEMAETDEEYIVNAADCDNYEEATDPGDNDGGPRTSATARDYGPSNPWDAPGMSIRDFI